MRRKAKNICVPGIVSHIRARAFRQNMRYMNSRIIRQRTHRFFANVRFVFPDPTIKLFVFRKRPEQIALDLDAQRYFNVKPRIKQRHISTPDGIIIRIYAINLNHSQILQRLPFCLQTNTSGFRFRFPQQIRPILPQNRCQKSCI